MNYTNIIRTIHLMFLTTWIFTFSLLNASAATQLNFSVEKEHLCSRSTSTEGQCNTMDSYSQQSNHRPYIRNALARAMYAKMMEDQGDKDSDHELWYSFDTSILPEAYRDLFVQLEQDPDTKQFLEQSSSKSEALFTQLYHQVAKTFLCWFISNTSINGLLHRGSMFVFSKPQFDRLLHVDDSWKAAKLLDLGAGDGMVTKMMGDHFEEVYATEMSTPMQWRLSEKGYSIIGIDDWSDGTQLFDVIACLNLLDRCDKPVKLLHDMKKALVTDTGRIVIALVLPFKPYVEFKQDHSPEQYLHIEGETFEEQASHFITDVFEPAGLEVTAISRVPYLCEGDLEHSYYRLNNVLFVLKVKS